MGTINILFLGGAKRVSLAEHFIKAGERLGQKINIFSYELQKECPIAAVGTVIIGKRWKDEALAEDLIEAIQNNQINIILPFVDPAVEIAALERDIRPDLFIPVSDLEICSVMFDKKKSEQWFVDNGIAIPKSYQPNDELEFPIIIKPRRGSASQGIEIINSWEEWKKVKYPGDYVIQHYIEDKTEYTVDCYVSQKGEIISVVPRERLVVAGGEVMNSKTLHDEQLEQQSRKILKTGNFRGPNTIQFIKDNKTGEVFVMEINPRLGGGVIASIEAGADIPTFIINEYMGKEISPCTDWKPNTLMTRYTKEVMFYADNH